MPGRRTIQKAKRVRDKPPLPQRRLEIQIHHNDIRRGVRYIFLSYKQVAWIVCGILLFLSFVGTSLSISPEVVGNMLRYPEHRGLLEQEKRFGRRLEPLVEELGRISGSTREVRVALDRIYVAYGLESDETIGQGGYPAKARKAQPGQHRQLVQRGFDLQAEIDEQQRVLGVFLDEVQLFEQARREQMLTTPSLTPLRGDQFVLTSPFGNRRSPFTNRTDFHPGLDLAAPVGLPVYAPADGRVVFAGRYPQRRSINWWRYGNLVVLKHGEDFITLYAHCETVDVRRGQPVKRGDRLATVGNTGFSTNPHLHYEIRRREPDGKLVPVDPRIYMFDLELSDPERLLVANRRAPNQDDYEPLPRLFAR